MQYVQAQQENAKLRRELEAAARQADAQSEEIDGPDGDLRTVVLDAAQMGLDIAGVIDPTPASDGANALISLSRGEIKDAGINALSMIPYLGDLAKLGKLGKYPQKLARTIDLALKSEKAMAVLKPLLKRLQGLLQRIPLEKLPDRLRAPLESLRKQLDNFFRKADILSEHPPVPRVTPTTSEAAAGTLRKGIDPGARPEPSFTPAERNRINEIGGTHGCHSCGSKTPGTPSGNFVPDHQPPFPLLLPGMTQRLYPHCLKCSRIQGGQVRA